MGLWRAAAGINPLVLSVAHPPGLGSGARIRARRARARSDGLREAGNAVGRAILLVELAVGLWRAVATNL